MRAYSRLLGKNAACIRSAWIRSIMTTSGAVGERRVEVVADARRPGRRRRPARAWAARRASTSAPSVVSSHTFDRATRECRMSPTIVDAQAVESAAARGRAVQPAADREGVEQRLRRVLVRAVAGVDDAGVDPAARREGARSAGRAVADDDGVRPHRLRASARCPSGSRPSRRSSPSPLKLMTSAESRFAAASNEMRVRVESSKKRFTTVLPRSVGSFLTSRSCVVRHVLGDVEDARARRRGERSLVSSRCLISPRPRRS